MNDFMFEYFSEPSNVIGRDLNLCTVFSIDPCSSPDNYVSKLNSDGYVALAEADWRKGVDTSPHGVPWHTSFHASSFPSDSDSCARKQLYTFLSIPEPQPINEFTRNIFDAGKDIETNFVNRLHSLGVLLSAPTWSKKQTSFKLDSHWLTGSCDAIIKDSSGTRPYVIEVKTKSSDKIYQMRSGACGYDDKHKSQLLTYLSLLRVMMSETDFLSDYDLPEFGSIFYLSRENPSLTHEFVFKYDDSFFQDGLSKLAEWRDYFLDDVLPPVDEGRQWSKGECASCSFKKHACKPDSVSGVDKLSETCGVSWAKEVYDNYDVNDIRERVIKRWI